jgi:hypothetical protein
MDRMFEEVGRAIPVLRQYLNTKRAMDTYRSEKHGQYNEIVQD